MGHNVGQLAGRDGELAVLEAALAGRGSPAVAVVGEPGIGKSRLLAEAISKLTDPRTLITSGRAAEFERQLPFGVLIDALDAYVGSLAQRRLAVLGDTCGQVLARVFPSLATLHGPASPTPGPSQLNHALHALLSLLAGRQRLVLALDDLHWADQASLEVVVHLLHRPVPGTELVIAFRPARAPALLRYAVDAACARGDCTEIALHPLTPDDAKQLLAGVGSSERRGAIYLEAGGNPFYLQQLARVASSDEPAAGAELAGVPQGVARALAAELAELPAPVRTVVDAAAVAGEPFSQELVTAISGLDASAVRDGLDEAVARGLATPTPVPGRFVFRHPIVRRAVYASSRPAWRVGAHERAAEALRVAGAPPSRLAHHVELSGRTDAEAVELFVAAGRQSARVAPASAVRWYRAAARTLPDDAEPEQRLPLLVPLAGALTASGQLQPAWETLREILDLLPPEPTALRARPLVAMSVIERVLGHDGQARTMVAEVIARAAAEPSAAAPALELELAADRYAGRDWPAMATHAEGALTRARAHGDDGLVAAAGAVLGLAEINAGQVASARRRAAECARIVDRLPDREVYLHLGAIHWLGWCEHHLELYDDVLRHYDRGLAHGARSGQRHLLIPMLLGFTITHTWMGNLAGATESAQDAIDSAQLVGARPLIELTFALRSWLAVRTGGLPAAIAACAAGSRDGRGGGGLHAPLTRTLLGEALIENGDPRTGRDTIVSAAGGPDLPAIEPSQRAYFCELLTRAELAIGAHEQARGWAQMADESATRLDLRGPAAWALRARAELALAGGDASGAAEHAFAAVTTLGDTHPLERERCRLLAGRALATIGDPAATGAISEAHTTLGEFGAERLQAFAARELRAQGRRFARAGTRSRGHGELAALSGRELEVATLVAEHLTNREIAERLILSPKTIERHMEHIFTKLGVESRGALARLVLAQRVP